MLISVQILTTEGRCDTMLTGILVFLKDILIAKRIYLTCCWCGWFFRMIVRMGQCVFYRKIMLHLGNILKLILSFVVVIVFYGWWLSFLGVSGQRGMYRSCHLTLRHDLPGSVVVMRNGHTFIFYVICPLFQYLILKHSRNHKLG